MEIFPRPPGYVLCPETRVPTRTPQIRKNPVNPRTGSGFGIGFGRSGIRSDAENPQTSGVLTGNPLIRKNPARGRIPAGFGCGRRETRIRGTGSEPYLKPNPMSPRLLPLLPRPQACLPLSYFSAVFFLENDNPNGPMEPTVQWTKVTSSSLLRAQPWVVNLQSMNWDEFQHGGG
ncbi:uncharacterized protein PGTG_19347 [Puccinia graminis f. sp. tritici CRL 75-36-700-3]|uniref:Uncharacterized protein n=1 Tax=Puccinia graminis f. sp. tritici (strain CRL 75-36-700-3 / race SCCL) TaxID=418459 RepID=E3LAW1_PUCGT|nr:uncharacterized protein PGTG_19347 [Puccinia graminis f. sp. tritici CRL 75-36-700-3]EFP93686.2 hypothetical protein PGTG_19347 [Puccinia graminis f. sp. tritici CRL 75-36-700-3]